MNSDMNAICELDDNETSDDRMTVMIVVFSMPHVNKAPTNKCRRAVNRNIYPALENSVSPIQKVH